MLRLAQTPVGSDALVAPKHSGNGNITKGKCQPFSLRSDEGVAPYGMGEHTDKPQFPILLKPMVDFSPPPLDFPRDLCYNIPNENPL